MLFQYTHSFSHAQTGLKFQCELDNKARLTFRKQLTQEQWHVQTVVSYSSSKTNHYIEKKKTFFERCSTFCNSFLQQPHLFGFLQFPLKQMVRISIFKLFYISYVFLTLECSRLSLKSTRFGFFFHTSEQHNTSDIEELKKG